jgi:hypothetical protein
MKIQIQTFKGHNLKLTPNLLDPATAQRARNLKLVSGDVRGWRKPLLISTLSTTGIKTIFQWYENTNKRWVTSTSDLNHVRSFLSNDPFCRCYVTGYSEPRVFADDIISIPFNPTTDYYKLGTKAPTAAPTFTSGHTGGANFRGYVYTYVSRYGEEGPPSPVLSTTTYNTGNVVIGGFTDPSDAHLKTATGGATNRPKLRLYRTASSTSGVGAFQFVKEVYCDSITWASFTITDDVSVLGEVIPCVDWYPPPSGLKGIIGLTNGIFAGFNGNELLFSEPNLPHAWNPDYSMSFEEQIIGLGFIGTMVVVCTDQGPYIVSGYHPSTMQKIKLPGFYPCVSKRGIVSTEMGVMYPSTEGLVLVNEEGVKVMTRSILSDYDMLDYQARDWTATYFNGLYIAFYDTVDAEGGIVFDLREGNFSDISLVRGAVYVSPYDQTLYLAGRDLPSNTQESIQQWEGDKYNFLNWAWKSKLFMLDAAINFSTARITMDGASYDNTVALIEESAYLATLNQTLFTQPLIGDLNAYELNGEEVNGDILYTLYNISIAPTVNVKVYADSVLRFEKEVSNTNIFRLPAGFRAKNWEVQIEGFIPVKEIVLANSVKEVMGNG